MHKFAALLAGGLFAGVACADEVAIEVVFADGFDPLPATVYRIGSIALRDPHVFYTVGFCLDVTATLNQQLQQELDADDDGDGFYDASPLAILKPYAEDGRVHLFESGDGVCTTASPSHCTPGVEPPVVRWYEAFDLSAPTVCLGALPGTTTGYTPPVPTPDGQCFATTSLDTTLPLGPLVVPLRDTQFAAPWPALGGSTAGGLLRGFLREADADAIDVDLNGQSVPLSQLLPDGTGSCATNVPNGLDSDRDEAGWWLYLEYRLDAVSSSGF